VSAFEEYPLLLETPLMGVERDSEALPTTTKLSLRHDEVEAIPCYVWSVRQEHAERHDSAQEFMLGLDLGLIWHSPFEYATRANIQDFRRRLATRAKNGKSGVELFSSSIRILSILYLMIIKLSPKVTFRGFRRA